MNLKSSVCSACLAIAFGSVSAFSQDQLLPSNNSPFSIQKGSSFSASSPKNNNQRPPREESANTDVIISDIFEAIELINSSYISTIDIEELKKNSISSMLSSLDPHSNYYDRQEYQDLTGRHAGEYVGIGVSIGNFQESGKIETFILGTAENSAAANAGLTFGDKLIAVDGVKTTGFSATTIRELIRGKDGTIAKIEVERHGRQASLIFEVKRSSIDHRSVPHSFIIQDRIGYINMGEGFSRTTVAEFETAMSSLKSKGASSLIIDLRGNRGGILEQAVKIAEKFLPSGRKILSQRGRIPTQDRVWISQNADPENMPLIVLVDKVSASAAEIVAGAFQDNDRAMIVGENTFGKGLVQNVIPLPDGSGITLTAARYYTPSGRSIQREFTEGEMYAYFNRTSNATAIESSRFASKTLSNRIVYGGNGIEPDREYVKRTTSEASYRLIDPIFFFVRNKMAEESFSTLIRQNIIFGRFQTDNDTFEEFITFLAKNNEWNDLTEIRTLQYERDFIKERLSYYLALAAFGGSSAFEVNTHYDKQVTEAVKILPQSAELSESARRTATLTDPFNK